MVTFKLRRYAVRNGNRVEDIPGEVEWKMKAVDNGLYFETENNVYFLDFRKQENNCKLKIVEKAI